MHSIGRRLWIVCVVAVCATITGCQSQMTTPDSLDQLFADYWEDRMERSPTWATYEGDHRWDSLLADVSQAGVDAETEAFIGRTSATSITTSSGLK